MAPTLIDLDSYGHQTAVADPNGSGDDFIGIYDNVNGSANISFDTTNVRIPGFHTASVKIAEDGVSVTNFGRSITATTLVVSSIYFRATAHPSGNSTFHFHNGPTNRPLFGLSAAGKVRVLFNGGSAITSSTDMTDGNWHRIDYRVDTSGTTHTIDWYLDGTAQTQATLAGQTAGETMTGWRMGHVSAGDSATVWLQDFTLSATTGDYPIGYHRVGFILPASEGTDALGTTNPIVNQAAGNTNLYQTVDEWPANTTDYVTYTNTATGDAASNYAEFVMGNAVTPTVWAVQGLIAGFAAGTAGDRADTRVYDNTGSTLYDHIGGLIDYSGSTTVLGYYRNLISISSPTTSTASGLRVRWGYSTDTNPLPRLSAVAIEYAGQATFTVSASVDADIFKTLTAAHTVDAYITKTAIQKTHGIDAQIYVPQGAGFANLTTGSSNANTGPYATNAFEVANGDYLLVTFVSHGSTPRNLTAVADFFGSSLTWSTPVNGASNNGRILSYAWAKNTSGSTQVGGLSLTTSGSSSNNVSWSVDKFTGMLNVAPLQSVAGTGTGSPATATLAALRGSLSVGVFLVQQASNATATMTGWTFLGGGAAGVRAAGADDFWVAYKINPALSLTMNIGGSAQAYESFALELLPSTNGVVHGIDGYVIGLGTTKTFSADAVVAAAVVPGTQNVDTGIVSSVSTLNTNVFGVAAGEFALVSMVTRTTAGAALATVTGLGLTWSTPVTLVFSTNVKVSYSYAFNDSGRDVYGSLAFTMGGVAHTSSYSVDKFAHRKNAAPQQSVTNTGTTGPATDTLSALALASDVIFLVGQNTNTIASMTGFTFLGAGVAGVRLNSSTDHWVAYDDSSPPTALSMTVGTGAAEWGGIALELLGNELHHAVDAFLIGTSQIVHSVDAIIQTTGNTVSSRLDAFLLKGASHDVDASIKRVGFVFTGRAGARISMLGRIELGEYGILTVTVHTVIHALDADIFKTSMKSCSIDAVIQKRTTAAYSVDAIIDSFSQEEIFGDPTVIEYRKLSKVD